MPTTNVRIQYEDVFECAEKDTSNFVPYTCICNNFIWVVRVKTIDTKGAITVTKELLGKHSENMPVKRVINISSCWAGFAFSGEAETCICVESIAMHAQCKITSDTITRNDTSGIRRTNESIMVFVPCTFDYCNKGAFSIDDPDDQCEYNRSGTLQGDCAQGYGLILGSNQCWNCTIQAWKLQRILLSPTLAGIGLITLLIVRKDGYLAECWAIYNSPFHYICYF